MKNEQDSKTPAAPPLPPANGSGAGLDYEILINDGDWQVWTPAFDGAYGACIGSGVTERASKEDAIRNMEVTCERLMGMRPNEGAKERCL